MSEQTLMYEPGDHVFTLASTGRARLYVVRDDGTLDYQHPKQPVRASDMPVGTVVTTGHPANGRLVFRAADGWFLVHNRQPVNPEDEFRGGWDIYDPVSQA